MKIETTLPTTTTDGFEHHFSEQDQIKWFPEDSLYPVYGKVVRINKKTITIKSGGVTFLVDPRELIFD